MARQIANPDYFVDETPYKLLGLRLLHSLSERRIPKIDSVGIDIWTMDKGIIFDNIVVDKDVEKVLAFQAATWKARSALEAQQARDYLQPLGSAQVYIVAVLLLTLVSPCYAIMYSVYQVPGAISRAIRLLFSSSFESSCRTRAPAARASWGRPWTGS